MAMWVVMTSSAQMPNSCWGKYRRVALVLLTQEYTARNMRPAMISSRARGVVRLEDMGHHSVGKTDRCAYARTLKEATRRAHDLNNAPCTSQYDEMLMSWGGSA